jgi:hypothetical protein
MAGAFCTRGERRGDSGTSSSRGGGKEAGSFMGGRPMVKGSAAAAEGLYASCHSEVGGSQREGAGGGGLNL